MLSAFGDRTVKKGLYRVSMRDLASSFLISASTEGVVMRTWPLASNVEMPGVFKSSGDESRTMVWNGFVIAPAFMVLRKPLEGLHKSLLASTWVRVSCPLDIEGKLVCRCGAKQARENVYR